MRFFRKKRHSVDTGGSVPGALPRGALLSEADANEVIPEDLFTFPQSKEPVAEAEAKVQEELNEELLPPGKYPKRLYIRCNDLQDGSEFVRVNDDFHPHIINNGWFTGHVVFRVRDFDGMTLRDPKDSSGKHRCAPIPTTPYFDGHRRAFSMQVSGRFKHAWTANDVMFGTFFEKPLILPRGYKIALALARRIDSSMQAELDLAQPFMCSPLICAMNLFNVRPLWSDRLYRHLLHDPCATSNSSSASLTSNASTSLDPNGDNLLLYDASRKKPVEAPLELPPWSFGGPTQLSEQVITEWSGTARTETSLIKSNNAGAAANCKAHIRTNTVAACNSDDASAPRVDIDDLLLMTSISESSKSLSDASNRRSYFLDQAHRKRFVFHPDTLYSFDFFSPYVDLNRFQLKLGISIDVSYYLQGQPVRYQCRTMDGLATFFSFELGLK